MIVGDYCLGQRYGPYDFFKLVLISSIYNVHFYFSVTNITGCWGLCNLCRQVNVSTAQSSYYRHTARNININLTANRAVNGKFLDHNGGDCAGTSTDKNNKWAWWKISLPDMTYIYKINLMFRENSTFIIPENNT